MAWESTLPQSSHVDPCWVPDIRKSMDTRSALYACALGAGICTSKHSPTTEPIRRHICKHGYHIYTYTRQYNSVIIWSNVDYHLVQVQYLSMAYTLHFRSWMHPTWPQSWLLVNDGDSLPGSMFYGNLCYSERVYPNPQHNHRGHSLYVLSMCCTFTRGSRLYYDRTWTLPLNGCQASILLIWTTDSSFL